MFEIPDREKLLIYGERMIHIESEPVTPEEFDLLPELREYMRFIMERHNGCGLAAPQVGIFKNFVILQSHEGELLDMVNSDILQMWGHEKEGFEACLSLPPVGNGCPVARLQHIKVEYSTADHPTTKQVRQFSNMDSIVAQHELDHLTGTFFIDRASDARRKDVLKLFEKWKQNQVKGELHCKSHYQTTHRS